MAAPQKLFMKMSKTEVFLDIFKMKLKANLSRLANLFVDIQHLIVIAELPRSTN